MPFTYSRLNSQYRGLRHLAKRSLQLFRRGFLLIIMAAATPPDHDMGLLLHHPVDDFQELHRSRNGGLGFSFLPS